MKKPKIMSAVLMVLGLGMIAIAIFIQNSENNLKKNTINKEQVDVKSMASAINKTKQVDNTAKTEVKVEEVAMEQAPSSTVAEEEQQKAAWEAAAQAQAEAAAKAAIVYDGMNMEQLSAKLDRSLHSLLSGKGNLIATRCHELGVDPYVAVAIMLHETGCSYSCSSLMRTCNNVGGQKGAPSCNGSYKGYSTLDEGIVGFIDNLYNNYYSKGLTTIDTIAPRYAESAEWPAKIHAYVNQISAA